MNENEPLSALKNNDKKFKFIMDLKDGHYVLQLLNENLIPDILEELLCEDIEQYHVYGPSKKVLTTHYLLKNKDHETEVLFNVASRENDTNSPNVFGIVSKEKSETIFTKYQAAIILPFFEKMSIDVQILYLPLEKIRDENGIWYDIDKLPHGFVHKGDLNLNDFGNNPKLKLPVNMHVKGSFSAGKHWYNLPICLTIDHNFYNTYTSSHGEHRNKRVNLPYGLIVNGSFLAGTIHVGDIHSLGNNTIIKGDLVLQDQKEIKKIPDDMQLGKSLYLRSTMITEIHENSITNNFEHLVVLDQEFQKLPSYIKNYSELKLACYLKERMPEDLVVRERLELSFSDNNSFVPLPIKITSLTKTVLSHVKLPVDLSQWKINGDFMLVEANIIALPNELKLSNFTLCNSTIEKLPKVFEIENRFSVTNIDSSAMNDNFIFPKLKFCPKDKLELNGLPSLYKHELWLSNLNLDEIEEGCLEGFTGMIKMSFMKKFPKLPSDLNPNTKITLNDIKTDPISLDEYYEFINKNKPISSFMK